MYVCCVLHPHPPSTYYCSHHHHHLHHYLPSPCHHITSPPITHIISHPFHHYHYQPSSSSLTITLTTKHHPTSPPSPSITYIITHRRPLSKIRLCGLTKCRVEPSKVLFSAPKQRSDVFSAWFAATININSILSTRETDVKTLVIISVAHENSRGNSGNSNSFKFNNVSNFVECNLAPLSTTTTTIKSAGLPFITIPMRCPVCGSRPLIHQHKF
ncbi:hypothetical protein E2C01_050725 [Portunus trituberculatus]|uniref:Uncharacterized protein n=1 Tax=Portunus trituberculatus TaxID=210409 RepID=A0A5B7GGW7_PORTR|nr:hypothetical protein [Portunus trituberculatus]